MAVYLSKMAATMVGPIYNLLNVHYYSVSNTDGGKTLLWQSKNTVMLSLFYTEMNHVMRKLVYDIREQQRRRSACASAQSDQRLCCSLPG